MNSIQVKHLLLHLNVGKTVFLLFFLKKKTALFVIIIIRWVTVIKFLLKNEITESFKSAKQCFTLVSLAVVFVVWEEGWGCLVWFLTNQDCSIL